MANASLKLAQTTGQGSQAYQQIYNRIKVLKWANQSPDFKPIEILQWDLKRAVH